MSRYEARSIAAVTVGFRPDPVDARLGSILLVSSKIVSVPLSAGLRRGLLGIGGVVTSSAAR